MTFCNFNNSAKLLVVCISILVVIISTTEFFYLKNCSQNHQFLNKINTVIFV